MLAGVSIIVALALTALVGQVFELSFFVSNMITMMGLAVGIDYVLFIVSRYREERAAGLRQAGRHRAIRLDRQPRGPVQRHHRRRRPGRHADRSDDHLHLARRRRDPRRAGAVAAALTLLPAVLVAARRPHRPRPGRPAAAEALPPHLHRSRLLAARRRRRHAPPRRLAGRHHGRVLLLASVPYWSINTGAAGIETLPSSLQSRQAFDVLARDFSVGGIAPARIPVSGEAEAQQITDAIAGDARFGTPVLTAGRARRARQRPRHQRGGGRVRPLPAHRSPTARSGATRR